LSKLAVGHATANVLDCRQSWGRDDALIVSDCGALGNMRADPTNWSPEEVVANSFNAGLDLNTGAQLPVVKPMVLVASV
jgi:beta-glucosidase-like glycosyl hydrolase